MLPVAKLAWTSDWRTQFSVGEERAEAWRYQLAVKDCNCTAAAIMFQRTEHLDHQTYPEALWCRSEADPFCINISSTINPTKWHLMNTVRNLHLKDILSCRHMCFFSDRFLFYLFLLLSCRSLWFRNDRLSVVLKITSPSVPWRGCEEKQIWKEVQ